MRVVLPFKLDGQTLVKQRGFPKSVADGSKDSVVIKVDGIPDGCVAKGYFKLSWENNATYDLTFNGDELVVDEYIITLPAHANNKYIDYKFSFSVAIWEGDVERLTTNPVEIVVEKSNYSDETTNTPDVPQSQYEELLGDVITSIITDDELSVDSTNPVQNKVITGKINELMSSRMSPAASNDNRGQFVRSSGSRWTAVSGELLPVPTEEDENKIPKVVDGNWVLVDDVVDTELDPTSYNAVANAAVAQAVQELDERVAALESDEPEVVVETLTLDDATEVKKGYIVEDGSFRAHNTNWLAYVFNVSDLDVFSVSASVYSDSDLWNVIAFYGGTEISTDNFISGVKRPSTVIHPTFTDVSVPEGTKMIVISNRIASGTDESAEIKHYVTVENGDAEMEALVADVDNLKQIVNNLADTTFGKGNIKAIYRDVPCNNDFTVVGDEIWFAQDYEGQCHVHRYKIVDGALVLIEYNILTDFGHWNTVDYNEENDCLVFGNGGNSFDTEGNFFAVVPNPRAITGSATLDTHAIKYPVDIGYKVQAVWGDSNLGKNNIVYLFANSTNNVVKVMLKQDEDGSFYKNPNTGEGEYIVLESKEQMNNHIGVGGADFWGDTLYIGNGGDIYGLEQMSMSDYSVKSMRKHYYYDDGTEYAGCTQGVHVDSDYLWVLSNVSAATAENGFENYLIQYYR